MKNHISLPLLFLIVACGGSSNSSDPQDDDNTGSDSVDVEIVTGKEGVGVVDESFSLSMPDGSTEVPLGVEPLQGFWVTPQTGSWLSPPLSYAEDSTYGPLTSYSEGDYTYATKFVLEATSGASLDGEWASDDGITIYLNQNVVLQVEGGSTSQYNQLHDFSVNDSSMFVVGQNTLEIVVTNISGPSGMYFKGAVSVGE